MALTNGIFVDSPGFLAEYPILGDQVAQKPEVIYVGDPMCSWCWGLAPVMHHIAERTDVEVRVLVGGLRPGPNAQRLDDRMRRELAHHWEKVATASGQPFDTSVLERQDWVYDTELPSIAVTTMRRHAPSETLGFFTHLQQAFYADAIDVTDPAQYPGLLTDYAVDRDTFVQEMLSDEARTRTWQEFGEARELGVAGFPTVLLKINGTTQVLSRGYAGQEYFDNVLAHWMKGNQPGLADAEACSTDGTC